MWVMHSSTSTRDVRGSSLSLTLRANARADKAKRGSITEVLVLVLLPPLEVALVVLTRCAALGNIVPRCYQREKERMKLGMIEQHRLID